MSHNIYLEGMVLSELKTMHDTNIDEMKSQKYHQCPFHNFSVTTNVPSFTEVPSMLTQYKIENGALWSILAELHWIRYV